MKERIKKLNSLNKFGLLTDIKLDKKEYKVLKTICENDKKIDFFTLCRKIDIKPSKLDKILEELRIAKLIDVNNEKITLLELGVVLSSKSKKQENRNKKFKKFVDCLTDQEFEQFCKMCDSMKTDFKMELVKEIDVKY